MPPPSPRRHRETGHDGTSVGDRGGAGRGRSQWAEELYDLDVDVLAVERLASAGEELPELVEGAVVGSFDA